MERYPGNIAVVYLGEKFSYRRLKDLSDRFAAGLAGLGVKPGDKVILYLSNCIQWVVAFLGIQKAGAVVVPVSPIYTSHEIAYMVQDSGAGDHHLPRYQLRLRPGDPGQHPPEKGHRHQPGRPASGLEADRGDLVRQNPRRESRTGQPGRVLQNLIEIPAATPGDHHRSLEGFVLYPLYRRHHRFSQRRPREPHRHDLLYPGCHGRGRGRNYPGRPGYLYRRQSAVPYHGPGVLYGRGLEPGEYRPS